jgi:putative membrane protein
MINERIKIGILLLSAGILTTLGAACTNQPGNTGTANSGAIVKTEPAKPASDKGDMVVTGGDLAFMNDAAPGGLAEVELGKLAAQKAQSAEVKAFAQKMVEDHSKAGEELKQLASQKKVTLPTEILPKHKEIVEKLSKLSGADFDREYVKAMVADHEKDVTAFNSVAIGATDADVKAFAAKTLPTLKMHLEMIKAMADKMGEKAKP